MATRRKKKQTGTVPVFGIPAPAAVKTPTPPPAPEPAPAPEPEESFVAPGLTTAEVAARVGVTPGRLSQWVTEGLIRPSISNPGKQGLRQYWAEGDVARCLELRQVAEAVRGIVGLAEVGRAIQMRATCTPSQIVVLTDRGPRILDDRNALADLRRISRTPMLVLV